MDTDVLRVRCGDGYLLARVGTRAEYGMRDCEVPGVVGRSGGGLLYSAMMGAGDTRRF